jgi:transmembrane sensor
MTRAHEELRSIPDQAAQWWMVLQDGEPSAAEKREFAKWALEDSGRIKAMLRLARIHKALSRSQVRWPDTPAEVLIRDASAASEESVFPLRQRAIPTSAPRRQPVVRIAFGLAAALMLAVGVSWIVLTRPEQFATRLGEQRSVMLADGSRITLNTASRIEVRLRADRRVIDLVEGEALFDVAHDARRPFDVRAGNVVLRVVGTQFDVDRREMRTVVTVTEGRVAVIANDARAGQVPVLSPGDRVVVDGAGVRQIQKGVNLAEATAWTQRQLVFRQRPLGDVAAELNRYNVARVEIRSQTLRSREVTGTFRTDDVASFVALLSGIPGVRVGSDGSGGYIVTSDEPAAARK